MPFESWSYMRWGEEDQLEQPLFSQRAKQGEYFPRLLAEDHAC